MQKAYHYARAGSALVHTPSPQPQTVCQYTGHENENENQEPRTPVPQAASYSSLQIHSLQLLQQTAATAFHPGNIHRLHSRPQHYIVDSTAWLSDSDSGSASHTAPAPH